MSESSQAAGPTSVRGALRALALGLPEAHEDFPWGERVVKVRNKIFAFLGTDGGTEPGAVGVKLVESLEQALAVPGAAPMGYGLGKAGWVTVPLDERAPPVRRSRSIPPPMP